LAVYKSVGQFAKECSGFQNSLRRAMVEGVNAAAFVTKKSVVGAADTRGWPRKRSRQRRRQPVVAVTYTIATAGTNPVALVRLRNGAMYERGAPAHEIVARRRMLSTPYGPRQHVNHPGFHGRPFWHAGIAAARPQMQRIFGAATVQSLARTFGKG